jgi:zinc protease
MTLLVREDHSVPIVSVRAVYPGGLRFESEENNGINNFVADLLTGGTASRTADEIAHEIESMAGSISGFSGRNSIGLQLTVLSRELEKALEILADCATNSVFPHAEVERVRHEILADIEAQRDDLAGSAFRQMNRALFGEHPFGLEVLGRRETIEAMDEPELRRFYAAHLHPSRMTMAVVGDVDAATVILAVSRLFEVGGESVDLDVSVPPLVRRPREVVETHRDREQAHLVLGFQGVDLFSEDRWTLEVMAAILSGQGGRLFYELRDRQSLAYSVAAFNVVGLDAGYFAHYIATSPEKVDEAVAGIEREIRRLQEEPVTSEELERAQRYLVGQRAISAQRTSNRAAFLAFDEAYGLGYDHHMRYADRILQVTPEDIQRVASRYLDLDEGVLSIVRPAGVAGDDGGGASSDE